MAYKMPMTFMIKILRIEKDLQKPCRFPLEMSIHDAVDDSSEGFDYYGFLLCDDYSVVPLDQ